MILKQMSLEEFMLQAQQAQRVVLYQEIMADRLTPIGIVEQLPAEMSEGTLLESGLHTEDGRYSYIAFGLMAQLSTTGDKITQKIGENTTKFTANPFTVLRQLVKEFVLTNPSHELLRMQAAIGLIAYDAIRLREAIPDRHVQEQGFPDLFFNFYHTHLIFDHIQQKLLLAKLVEITEHPQQVYTEGLRSIQELVRKITQPPISLPDSSRNKRVAHDPTVDVSDEDFMCAIEKAKSHIRDGDAFQIVLSRCFQQTYTAKPFDIYRALRKISPAPYMFYFPMQTAVMVGASPEKMITVRQGQIEINPIAGTRPRQTAADEEKNARELLNDPKELAEHMMLVDLARNDLGSVCIPGSVKIKTLSTVKHFSHVSHLTSVVTGQLQADKDAFDALQATFPAGTVSGAPKIRAMEIIDTLETSKRGVYGGAFCRIDALGNFDSCIAIRMATLRDGMATIRTGAGIVAESVPASEAAETRHKAKGILAAIAMAEEELSC